MNEETKDSVTEIIKNLEDPENKLKAKEAILDNPVEDLRNDLLGFFKKRIKVITKTEDFKDSLQEELIKRINDPNEKVTFSQLSNLYISLFEQSSIASEGVLSLLKPSQSSGTQNPLLSSFIKKDFKTSEDAFSNLTSEEQRKIDLLFRIMSKLDDEDKKSSENIDKR